MKKKKIEKGIKENGQRGNIYDKKKSRIRKKLHMNITKCVQTKYGD